MKLKATSLLADQTRLSEGKTEEPKRFEFSYGIIMYRTQRFQSLMERLGRNRISRPTGWILLYLMPIAAAFGFYLFLVLLANLLSPRGAALASVIRSYGPLVNLGLPGINPYIPIVYGWIALIVAIVVHEGAHGVIARSLGLPVKSSGLLFLLIFPVGAFVEVDEQALKAARPSYSGRVLAGGAGVNLVIAVVCLALLVLTVSTMVPLTVGAGITGVATGKPAYNAGIRPGDFVTAVDGKNVTDLNVVLGENTTLTAGQSVNLTVFRDGRILQFDNVRLVCCQVLIDVQTNKTLRSWPYIGVNQITYSHLQADVSRYSSPLLNLPLYLCIPTFQSCQTVVPYSDSLAPFYFSSAGRFLVPLSNLLYWLFFLNFNLAIFNALPIYPLDGGQAFKVGVKALGGDRLSEKMLTRITGIASAAVLVMLIGVMVGPYLYALV